MGKAAQWGQVARKPWLRCEHSSEPTTLFKWYRLTCDYGWTFGSCIALHGPCCLITFNFLFAFAHALLQALKVRLSTAPRRHAHHFECFKGSKTFFAARHFLHLMGKLSHPLD